MSSLSEVEEIKPIQKKGSQLKALFLKNGLLQVKQPCTNICQIMTPVICLIFTYMIKKLATDNLPNGSQFTDSTYPYVFGDYRLLDSTSKIVNKDGTLSNFQSRDNLLEWYIYDFSSTVNQTLLGSNDGLNQKLIPDASILGSILNLPVDLPTNAYVDNFTIDYYTTPSTGVKKYLPFFIQTNYNDVNVDLFHNISVVEKESFQLIQKGRSGLDCIPDGAVKFQDLNATYLRASIAAQDIRDLEMHRNNGVSALEETRKLLSGMYTNGSLDIRSAYSYLNLQHYISQAFAWITATITVQNGWISMRETGTGASFVDSLINTVSALIFPLALSLLFPVMLYGLVLEKEEKLVQMMKMNGMRISTYWIVYAIFNILLAVVTNIIFFLLGALVLQTNFFTKTSPALLITVALGWIISQVGLAAFLQTLLDKARSANIVGYIFAIWTMMIGSTLSIGVYQVPNQFPGWIQAIPPFAFNRLFYLMLINCSDADCYNDMAEISTEMTHCIITLYVGGILLFLLGAYLLEVLPQEFGVRRHPLFPFLDFWKFITCKKKISYSRPQRDQELKKYLSNDEEDPLSGAEREAISKMGDSQRSWPLVINNLRKLYVKQGYIGAYAAVKSFNLRVAEKETFGLLGPNGAGKTTLINMLTGMINPDYGNAWIGGYDINTNVSKAQLQMGVCPQFDLLWPQLTVEEHLRFYARLKGIPGVDLESRVVDAIEEVNLTKFKNFLSSSLSGGMKRRLSIAISLVGDPKIVFLDEPSTGLDPDNRRQIWEVLVRCQDKRALFLTTHMMEEADALCHRIGIITHGTLRTVGNQLRLKKDYGQGYRVSLSLIAKEKKLITPQVLCLDAQHLNLSDERSHEAALRRSISDLISHQAEGESRVIKLGIKRIADFIFQRFPGSILSRILGGSVIFKIPITFKISQIFTEMHGVERQLGVTNVSITDSSLEDVFIAVVLKYDKITDDEETGEAKLITLINEDSEIVITPLVQSPLKDPEYEKQESLFDKDHESVMSQEIMKKANDEDDRED